MECLCADLVGFGMLGECVGVLEFECATPALVGGDIGCESVYYEVSS